MNATIVRLAVRSLFGQHRGWVLILLPVLLIGLCVAVRVLTGGDAASSFEAIVVTFGLGLVLPLVALLVTTGVLGPEIEDGSIVYLLSKPISRYVVAASKLAVAVATTVVLASGGILVAGFVLDPGEAGRALAVATGSAVAGAAYCALFVMLSSMTRHAMVAGLLYVLVLEGLLASWLTGLRYVSVSAFGRRIAEGFDDTLSLLAGNLPLTYAWLAAAVVLVAGCYVAGQWLTRFQLRGDD